MIQREAKLLLIICISLSAIICPVYYVCYVSIIYTKTLTEEGFYYGWKLCDNV